MDNHKEQIHRSIVSKMNNKAHYLGDNDFLPTLLGKKSFVYKESMDHFTYSIIKLKKSFNIDNVDKQTYFQLEKRVNGLLKNIKSIERVNPNKIEKLADQIINDYFKFDSDFDIKLNLGSSFNVLKLSKEKENYNVDTRIDSFLKIQEQNKNLDKRRLIYSIICGAANDMMNNVLKYEYEDELDSIDYNLQTYYKQYIAFNNFKIWVTPDDFIKQHKPKNNYEITENGITAHGDNLLFLIYQISKGVYSKLFDESNENEEIDYNNVWNLRIGTLIWNKIKSKIGHSGTLKHVIKDINDLDNQSFEMFFNELLSDTMKSDDIFSKITEIYT
jgi:hypothetical protein